MGRVEDKYIPALEGKKIPAVTLDHKWHQLFTRVEKTRKITEKELVGKDGVVVTEGLKAGEQIVTAGVTRLVDGQQVKVLTD